MIYDLSIGFNELDLFLIRYNELKDVADRFVVVEATHTHSGKPKPLYFSDLMNGTSEVGATWAFNPHRIEIIEWDNGANFAPCTSEYAWVRENYQREILGMWIKEHCKPNDLCMLSDMDEIPRADALDNWLYTYPGDENPYGVWRFDQVLSYLYFNTTAGGWGGTKIFRAEQLLLENGHRPMTDAIRYRPQEKIRGVIPHGGWHFSSCGGIDRVTTKLRSYAHVIDCAHIDRARIQDSLTNLTDPFNKQPLTVVGLETMPRYVQENIDYFRAQGYIYE